MKNTTRKGRPEHAVALVVFDLAGTILDYGSRAPLLAFRAAFAAQGVRVSTEATSAPMGLEKRAHLRAMLANPEVASAWVKAHGRRPSEEDLEQLYHAYTRFQMSALESCSRLIPGAAALSQVLRARGIRVATTTGYFPDAARRALELARAQGFESDADVNAGEVNAARPAPDMILLAMARCGVDDSTRVVNVGDTIHDVASGRNAGVHSIGVVGSSSLVGVTEAEWSDLDESVRDAKLVTARRTLLGAGADETIDDLRQLAALVVPREKGRRLEALEREAV